MDIETAEAVETLRADIHRVEHTVVRVETSLNATMHDLNAKMHELHQDAKRHSDVQIENVRDDIRLLAEHLVSLTVKVDSLRR